MLKAIYSVLFAFIIFAHTPSSYAATQDECTNLDKASIAEKAHLEDDYINRYQESVIYSFCLGQPEDIRDVNEMVDNGYVTSKDAEAIAQIFGVQYTAPSRSKDGQLYERINKSLSDKGLCLACASNVAAEYVKTPNSDTAKLVDAALSGSENALQKLQDGNYTRPLSDNKVSEPTIFEAASINLIISVIFALLFWLAIIAEVSSGRTNKFIKEEAFPQILLCALIFSIVLAIAYFSPAGERDGNVNAFWIFILLGALYFLPTILAFKFRRKNRKAICVLNIFLGWTGLGWIGALVWSFVEE